MDLRKSTNPHPVSTGEQHLARGCTLADIQADNTDEHAAGCHGTGCDGSCAEQTTARWTAAGWR